MVAATGCDAVMIGRTAPANPWIFRQIAQYCHPLEEAGSGQESGREGHGFSRAESYSDLISASAAERRFPGAEAPNLFGGPNGTTEVVPFPSVSSADTMLSGEDRVATKSYDEPSEADRYEMIRTYFRMLIEEELPDATGKMKQFASWFTHGVPGGAGLRKAIYDSKTPPEILTRVEEFFEARLAATVTA